MKDGKRLYWLNFVVILISIIMVLYHMISTQVALQSTVAHLNTHLGISLFLVFLSGAAASKGTIRRLCSLVLAFLTLLSNGYIQLLWPDLQSRAYFNTTTDLVIGVILIVLVLEATRREFGLFLPILVIIVTLYPFLGHKLPEPFYTHSLGLSETISKQSISLESGIFGFLGISANYMFLFVLFGSLLRALGGTEFFFQVARLMASKLMGGPAIMAVASSSLVGSITGSAAANVLITGVYTIPLMKKTGYTPEQAAGIEAAASNGGQIMPPVMGMVAFAMAGLTGIPYLHIILMALIPALIYFLCCGTYVYLRARQLKIGGMVGEKADIKDLILSAPSFFVPITVIVALLIMGKSVMYVAFWAIITAIAVSLIRKEKRPSLGAIINGFVEGAKSGAGLGASVACVGLLATTFTTSGLGVKLASGIEGWSGGHFFPALIIIWGICVLLGFGGLSLSAYLIVSIFAISPLLKLGVPFEIAHFFIMFVSVFAFITPPVAVVALVAARLSGASYLGSSIESTKVAIAGFLLPFFFVYCPILLLKPQNLFWEILGILAMSLCLVSLQIGFVGHYMKECSLWERILSGIAGVLLFTFFPLKNYFLFFLGVALFMLLTLSQWKKFQQ